MCNFVQFANSVTKFWIDCGSQCSGAYDDDHAAYMLLRSIQWYTQGKSKSDITIPDSCQDVLDETVMPDKKEHKRQAYKLLYLQTNVQIHMY